MTPPQSPPTNTQFNTDVYAHHIAELDLTEAQKDDRVRAVANIISAWINIGFGVGSGQLPCGEGDILGTLITESAHDLLQLDCSQHAIAIAPEFTLRCAELEES
jgi:hypothetical protein